MFKSRFGNWFFNTFYCIPIERPADVGGKKLDNKNSFARCDDFLQRAGILYIAPEGGSVMVRRLRPIKTGAARIAFSAEANNNFQLGLTILPVGLTYDDPTLFRKDLLIQAGEPIKVSDFKADWEKDEREAVSKLTHAVMKAMQALLLHTEPEDEDIESMLRQLENLHQSDHATNIQAQFPISKKWIKALEQQKTTDTKTFEQFKSDLATYFKQLKQQQIQDKAVVNKNSFGKGLSLLLGFPFFLYGYINNFLSIFIPGFIAKKLDLYVGYTSAVKTMTGLFLLPLFYFLQTQLVWYFTDENWWGWLYLASLIPMGIFAWWYRGKFNDFWQRLRFKQISKKDRDELLNLRANLLKQKDQL